jgi:hypothetical protein
LIVILITGSLVRLWNEKRSVKETDKVFDFAKATDELTKERIKSPLLSANDRFLLGDLQFHVHRINVTGNNTLSNPW